MKYFLIITVFTFSHFFSNSYAQKYRLSSSEVSFFSEAPMEDIEAYNMEAKSIFDAEAGEIAFVIPIKGFEFKKSLMQEHFNENYMESDKYPNAKFEGKLHGYKAGKTEQKVTAQGEMTIHGVTHQIEVPGTVKSNGSDLSMQATFPIRLEDYDIDIPKVVFYNIAEEVEVSVSFQYQPYVQ
ncbi:polyisoprenoid-binding protein YceI [Catalinimonas alkaloidigena]|uniref:YceI family protein n=1 Tax=Catalinimonas alkaloidigena TaxID=1075417 RepID=UPI00240534D8|nr:YceI family protein [Catalinimonas alkaloidigena]MDF9798736.1 polyisoprenoid-binding protein YceI [Catalinimonas alkaloidigena]